MTHQDAATSEETIHSEERRSTEGQRDVRWRAVRTWVGLAVGIALLWLALRNVAWEDFAAVLVHTRWSWLALAWATILLTTWAKASRWQYLFRASGGNSSWLRVLAILSVGQLVNVVVPSRLGELARAYLAGREEGGAFAAALGTIVVEKTLDGIAAIGLIVVMGLTLALPGWFRSASVSFASLLALLLLLVIGVTLARNRLAHWVARLPERWQPHLREGLRGIGILRERRALFPTLLLTVIIWLLAASTNYVLFAALGLPLSVAAALLVLVTGHIGALVPVVPGQLGVFHYLIVLALAAFGIGREVAMPYAIVLYVMVYGTIAGLGVGGLWWLSTGWHMLLSQLRTASRKATKTR
ncbi:MAG: hypothetical protein A2Y73_01230 [Chloroflexi bacterium RBG_13_56_8]|nr:MAG: hypothetical protein A2Y73_01230 [Chloroflexi bacterium RBG_13_56_8]